MVRSPSTGTFFRPKSSTASTRPSATSLRDLMGTEIFATSSITVPFITFQSRVERLAWVLTCVGEGTSRNVMKSMGRSIKGGRVDGRVGGVKAEQRHGG